MATAQQIRDLITQTTSGTLRPRVPREVRDEICRYAARRRREGAPWPVIARETGLETRKPQRWQSRARRAAPVPVLRPVEVVPKPEVVPEVSPPLALVAPSAGDAHPDEPREPRYDLARRLREHEIARFTELSLRPLEQNPGYATPPEPRSERIPCLLYALVIPLVAGLGWYVARTTQRGVPPEEPPAAT